ncbi:MAG: right-handed parallel beta-helix repeat-containing protein [Thermoflexales bacterium]|nr:right-handed parallel beta-helix repeat-containing protein [Thermoflexales bacterium]
MIKRVILAMQLTLVLGMQAEPPLSVTDVVDPMAPEASQQVFYVAPYGSDSNPGTESQPWRTIRKAAETLTAGQTVLIRAGTYREKVTPKHSGAPARYITYAAYPGEVATIDGEGKGIPDWGGVLQIQDRSYIRVIGLRITNAGPGLNAAGIYVNRSSNIIIERNHTYNTVSSGIGVWRSANVAVLNNEVELANNDGYQENITIASTSNFVVAGNHVHHGGPGTRGGEGIDVKHSHTGKVHQNQVHNLKRVGIYIDAWDRHTYDIEVHNNLVYSITSGGFAISSEMGGLLENVTLYNNIAYNTRYGVNIGVYGSSSAPEMRRIRIVNNTFVNNGSRGWGGGILVENSGVHDVLIANNIASGNLSFQIAIDPSVPSGRVTVTHNLIHGFRGIEAGETRGQNYVEGDPQFVNPSAGDFRLRANSPALNKGNSTHLPASALTDFAGNPRVVGTAVDIGAYELFEGSKIFLPMMLQR